MMYYMISDETCPRALLSLFLRPPKLKRKRIRSFNLLVIPCVLRVLCAPHYLHIRKSPLSLCVPCPPKHQRRKVRV